MTLSSTGEQTPRVPIREELPVGREADGIEQALKTHQVIIVAGETGSGKTTQLPKICLNAGRGRDSLIGHTQPRRLAARSVATRIAEELGETLGQRIGYQVRFTDITGPEQQIKLMTDGILLAETRRDPDLRRYDTLIIDEAHERSLNIDFLLGYLKQLLPRRPDLKLIITSATIDVERFSEHFDGAPVFEVSGRTYPVEVLYRPPLEQDDSGDGLSRDESIVAALEEITELERAGKTYGKGGDVLVFLPGEREIREAAVALRRSSLPHLDILPLYARLSAADQQRVFRPGRGRKIVLSTNVAETSITVPGIHYVIDTGVARISRYSTGSRVQRLPVEPIARASADQRAGRCGRIAPGLCVRLYSEEDYDQRPEFTDAEIVRTNLASVILQMLNLRLGRVDEFPFVDPPDNRQIRDGYQLLFELQAVDAKQKLTALGRRLARLPVDPRLGRMLLEADGQGSLREALVAVSFLAVQDPRERPAEKRAQADQKHAQDKDPDSDFATIVHLWQRFEDQRQALGSNALKQYCKREYLNFMRMREWREIHRQLTLMCRDLGLTFNAEPAAYDSLHRALLSGLLSQVAQWREGKEFLAARGRKAILFPGSPLYRKPPKWLMAAELVETSQLYARTVARIDPAWCEPLAPHLIRKQHSEPHFSARRAQVMAWEQVSLFGLIIVGRRKVNYARINAVEAREIFIRQGLVEGQYRSRAHFYQHNLALLEEVDTVEDKVRRRDLKVDDETLYQFYDERVPEQVVNGNGFERWRRTAEQTQPDILLFDRSVVWQQEPENLETAYPDAFRFNGMELPLDYRFAPGQKDDGITASVPLGALPQLTPDRLDWLVPGLVEEKAIALVKGLPKRLRRELVPVPDTVRQALDGLNPGEAGLRAALTERLWRLKGVRIRPEDWRDDGLEAHLQFNLRVTDENGRVVAEGRDLDALREQVADIPVTPAPHTRDALEQEGITQLDFPALPESHPVAQAGITLTTWPALVDTGDAVAVRLFTDAARAQKMHVRGLARLALLCLPDLTRTVREHLPNLKKSALLFAPSGQAGMLADDLLLALAMEVMGEAPLADDTQPAAWSRRSPEIIRAHLDQVRGDLVARAQKLDQLLLEVMQRRHAIMKHLKGKVSFALAFVYADVRGQLEQLVYPGFLADTPWPWRHELPRYLDAILMRLERSGGVPAQEAMRVDELRDLYERYQTRADKLAGENRFSPELEAFRWRLEEYRVSLFAQALGTAEKVSIKRLEKAWEALRYL